MKNMAVYQEPPLLYIRRVDLAMKNIATNPKNGEGEIDALF